MDGAMDLALFDFGVKIAQHKARMSCRTRVAWNNRECEEISQFLKKRLATRSGCDATSALSIRN